MIQYKDNKYIVSRLKLKQKNEKQNRITVPGDDEDDETEEHVQDEKKSQNIIEDKNRIQVQKGKGFHHIKPGFTHINEENMVYSAETQEKLLDL